MVKGGDELAGGRIPELGSVVRAGRKDPIAVRAKRPLVNAGLMGKRRDELAGRRFPELGGLVQARCQDPCTISTKRCVVDLILMFKGSD